MLSAAAAEGLSGLLEWSEPIIFDRLYAAYRAQIGETGDSWKMARLHCRVWRAMISGDMVAFEALRRDLIEALALRHLALDNLADADAQIMVELLEVVMTRYQRSMRTARGYHLALIELAGRLAPTQSAA